MAVNEAYKRNLGKSSIETYVTEVTPPFAPSNRSIIDLLANPKGWMVFE